MMPVDAYIEKYLPKRNRTSFIQTGGKQNIGNEIYEHEGRRYLAIFSRERIETKPLFMVRNTPCIKLVNEHESYASLEMKPKPILIASASDIIDGRISFEIRNIHEYMKRSELDPNKFKAKSYARVNDTINVSFAATGLTLNFFLDSEKGVASVWSTLENYKEMMEVGVDPFRLKKRT